MKFSQRIEAEEKVVKIKSAINKGYTTNLQVKYSKPLSKSSDYAKEGQTLFFPDEISIEKGTVQEKEIEGTNATFDTFLVADGDKDGTMRYLTFSKLYRSVTDTNGNEVSPLTMLKEYNKGKEESEQIEESDLVYTLWNEVLIPNLIFDKLQSRSVKWLKTNTVECHSQSTGNTYTTDVNLIVFND